MTESSFYKDRWLSIAPDKLERYQNMFQWNPASRIFYEAAEIREGHIVGELGCGPGHTAVEIARWVGAAGHVHALDINADFIAQAKINARAAGLEDRMTVLSCDGDETLPLQDASLDRITTRNTLIYVDGPAVTLKEFKRILKPGGLAHAIEGDWPMMVVEPLPQSDWTALIEAAGHACRTPDIGRKLHGLFVRAEFSDVQVQLITRPDTEGRLLGMVKNMVGFARTSGHLNESMLADIESLIDAALDEKTYLALAPQFVVTAQA